MTQQSPENQVRTLIEEWADAVRRHDYPAVLAHHDPDIVMFDVPPPLQSRGLDAYKATWDLFFRYHKPSHAFDIENIEITAGNDVAFAVAMMRCGPPQDILEFRLTVGLRRIDGAWRITHEHHSVPAID